MAVKYVSDFTFAPSPPRPTIRGYARGGHVKSGVSNDSGHVGKNGSDRMTPRAQGDGDLKRSKVSPDIAASRTEKGPKMAKGGHWIAGAIKHPGALHKEMGVPQGQKIPAAKLKAAAGKGGKLGQRARLAETLKGMGHAKGGSARCYAEGGSVAAGKVKMGSKPSRNPDDATSPGSFKRTPPSQGTKNSAAANSKFDAEGRNTPVATKQDGDVQRMSGYSDFKKGGTVKFERIKNLGHYAHGGKVKASSGEKASGKAGSGKVKAPVAKAPAPSTDRTPAPAGSRVEMKSGTAKAAMGGLSRGTSAKKNAAIHAKNKSHKPAGPSLGALAGALSGPQMPHQGAGAPPGMAPGMGAPPGGPMGAIAPQAPTMGGGPPAMSHGGAMHVVHHFTS